MSSTNNQHQQLSEELRAAYTLLIRTLEWERDRTIDLFERRLQYDDPDAVARWLADRADEIKALADR